MRRTRAIVAAALALAGCENKVCTPSGTIAAAPPPRDWREAVTDGDHVKLRDMRGAFVDGVASARTAGFGAMLDRGGRLYDPDYAEDGAALPPGAYLCTAVMLGGAPAYRPLPPHRCTVAADIDRIERFAEIDGVQRLQGRIYPDTIARTVLLGTVLLSDEATALHYGRDPDRDRVAEIKRIGRARWRAVIPHPAWGGIVVVMEIVPAGG